MVEIYTPDHFKTVLELHESHGHTGYIFPAGLPAIGYVAYKDDTALAAGFLRMVEGGYAMIDTLVSNGALPSDQRHLGVSSVVDALIQRSKDLKLLGIISNTRDSGILKRAEALGFKQTHETVIILAL